MNSFTSMFFPYPQPLSDLMGYINESFAEVDVVLSSEVRRALMLLTLPDWVPD